MDIEADFSGRAQFKSQYVKSGNQTKDELSLYDEYVGKYKINHNLTLSGVARFDEPHLSISKVGSLDPAGGSFINYVITAVNDGNRALGPVYVLDLFPPGTEYVYSTLRPSDLASNSVQWTLLHLGIGSSSTIELKLNATEDLDNLVNRVQARGGYNDEWVSAENYSALQLNWLSCCPPQLRTSKTGYVDANDSMLVHYRIVLKNRESYVMAATINDDLPGGMMFINSTVQPSDYRSGRVKWNIIDIKPAEVKVIDYLVRALQDGVFVNQAHIETTTVNGSDYAFADVSCQVQIGSGFNSGTASNWQPPACFGLNCTQQEFGEDWMPCYTCGAAEPQPLDTSCTSCVPAVGSDSDIP
jgi:large repetitive protein